MLKSLRMNRFLATGDWIATALGAIAVLAAISAYWGLTAELLNRALIVGVTGWLLYRSRDIWLYGDQRRGTSAGLLLSMLALIALPPGWFLFAQFGPRSIMLWWLVLSWQAAFAGLVLSCRGARALWAIAFPLMFLLFALPTPQRIERPLQSHLQEWTTALSDKALRGLAIHCERQGFVLSLPSGDLGVLEACSGIRSITALTAIAALVAYLRGMGAFRGIFFVPFCLPVVVVANVFRVVVSGVLQENVGVSAVQGTPHDLLGFTGVLLGLGTLLGLSGLFVVGRHSPAVMSPPELAPNQSRPSGRPRIATAVSWLTLAASVLAAGLGLRSVGHQEHTAPLDEFSMQLGEWRGEDVPIPATVQQSLMFDRARHWLYRNSVGQEVHVWVLFWSGAGSEFGFHSPDVCWPNRGWELIERRRHTLDISLACQLPVSVRQFRKPEKSQLLLYWVQDGAHVRTEEVEAARPVGASDYWWVRQRLTGQQVVNSGRLAVLMGTDLWGKGQYSEKTLESFGRLFVREVHRVLPWAAPTEGTDSRATVNK